MIYLNQSTLVFDTTQMVALQFLGQIKPLHKFLNQCFSTQATLQSNVLIAEKKSNYCQCQRRLSRSVPSQLLAELLEASTMKVTDDLFSKQVGKSLRVGLVSGEIRR